MYRVYAALSSRRDPSHALEALHTALSASWMRQNRNVENHRWSGYSPYTMLVPSRIPFLNESSDSSLLNRHRWYPWIGTVHTQLPTHTLLTDKLLAAYLPSPTQQCPPLPSALRQHRTTSNGRSSDTVIQHGLGMVLCLTHSFPRHSISSLRTRDSVSLIGGVRSV